MNASADNIPLEQLGERPESRKISTNSTEKTSICFVAHFAYGALASSKTGFIGGIERQISLMAKWLAKRGYRVSMITLDEGQKNGVEIDGMNVFKCYKELLDCFCRDC